MATLSQACGAPQEGAETTWGLIPSNVDQVPLMTGFERPAPDQGPWGRLRVVR